MASNTDYSRQSAHESQEESFILVLFAICRGHSVIVNPQSKPVKPRHRMLNVVNIGQIACKCFIMNNLQNMRLLSSQSGSNRVKPVSMEGKRQIKQAFRRLCVSFDPVRPCPLVRQSSLGDGRSAVKIHRNNFLWHSPF